MSIEQITDLGASDRPPARPEKNDVLSRMEDGVWRVIHGPLIPALLILVGFWLGAIVSAEVGGAPYSWMVSFAVLDIMSETAAHYSVACFALMTLFWLANRLVRVARRLGLS
jgi:hypothetical protein